MDMMSGTVAVLTKSDGSVLATVADFGELGPGYSNAKEAQKYRSQTALANSYIREWCGADIADVMRGYEAERIVQELCRIKGYRVTISTVEVPAPSPVTLTEDER